MARLRWRHFQDLWLLVAVSCAVHTSVPGRSQAIPADHKRPVVVPDAIEMVKLADPLYWAGAPAAGLVAHYSPDHKRFVVVLRKGDLRKNTNEYSMLMWRTDILFSAPSPQTLLTLSSDSNHPAIQQVRWLQDNDTIEFLGKQPSQPLQLYRFSVTKRQIVRVTDSRYDLLAYSTDRTGATVAYVAELPPQPLFDSEAERQGIAVSTEPLTKLLALQKGKDRASEKILVLARRGHTEHRIATKDRIDERHLALSPDGRHLVALLYVADLPEAWSAYSDPELQQALQQRRAAREWRAEGRYTWVTKYELIDTITGISQPLLDVPEKAWDTDVLWMPDSRSVVIANTFLPIPVGQAASMQSSTHTVEVNIGDGKVTPVLDGNVSRLTWSTESGGLVLEWRPDSTTGDSRRQLFRKIGGSWEKTKDQEPERAEPQITLSEDMKTPPKIVAADPVTARTYILRDLNPQFKELQFGNIEEIAWKTSDGVTVTGGLYYPINYAPGRRYPLVIQTHAWSPGKFWIDGPWTTAFAAQPLAGRGIMVLQAEHLSVDDAFWAKIWNTPEEARVETDTYLTAVDYLVVKGLVDPSRVGIIGFSRTSFYVKYALTHFPHRFAAASVTDGVDAGFFQYISNVTSNPQYGFEMERLNGGKPFGEGLELWRANSPGFNIDRVDTPVRILALNARSVMYEWEWFASLTRLGKPVEMVMLRDGDHLLQKPWERMVSQGGTVDWFCFWLKGEEDPDPAKAEQYKRWRELRKLQQQNEKNSRAPSPN